MKKWLIGIVVVLGFWGCSKDVNPYEGFKAYYFGDYHKAFQIYSQACESGDSFMCYNVAGM